jgi:hypothetical protein
MQPTSISYAEEARTNCIACVLVGKNWPRVWITTAAFDACDSGKQAGGDGVGPLCGGDGLGAGGGERREREGGVRGQRRYKVEQERKGERKPHWEIVGRVG